MTNSDSKVSIWVKLFSILGLDARVASGLMARLVPMAAAPISALIIAYKLNVESQGLFYFFNSILALRMLFELGVGTSVIQIAAHAREKAESSPLSPAFVVTVNRWMARISAIYSIFSGVVGYIFLVSKSYNDLSTVIAWIGFISISAAQFSSEGRWAMLEGADLVVSANRIRLKNSLLQYVTQWVLLLTGAGLFSFVGASFIAYISQEIRFRQQFFWLYAEYKIQNNLLLDHFRHELVKLIKRASQTYLTGYLVFQLQQPICFHILGASGSAQLGFTQSIGAALIGLPNTWLAMNFPRMSHMVADGEITKAKNVFKSRYIQLASLSVAASVFAWFIAFVLHHFARFENRLMSPTHTMIFYGALAIQTISLGLTYWPRAFKVEPFVRVAYSQMIITPVSLWVFGHFFGILGIALGNMLSWIVGVAGTFIVFKRFWSNPNEFACPKPSTTL